MTATITDTLGAGDTAVYAPLHCGDPMILRETSYRGAGYGMIGALQTGFDVELVWACQCGFQLSYAEPADLALPLSPALRRVAAATADLESAQWKLDQATGAVRSAVLCAAAAGVPVAAIAEAAQLDPADVRELISSQTSGTGAGLLSHVG